MLFITILNDPKCALAPVRIMISFGVLVSTEQRHPIAQRENGRCQAFGSRGRRFRHGHAPAQPEKVSARPVATAVTKRRRHPGSSQQRWQRRPGHQRPVRTAVRRAVHTDHPMETPALRVGRGQHQVRRFGKCRKPQL